MHNMNIVNAFRQAHNALCFDEPHTKYWYIIQTEFSQLVPAHANKTATLIEYLSNCKQNVYFRAHKHTHDFPSLVKFYLKDRHTVKILVPDYSTKFSQLVLAIDLPY